MSATEQRFPVTGIQRVLVEVDRTDVSAAWSDDDTILVRGNAVQVQPQGDCITIEHQGRGRLQLTLPASIARTEFQLRHSGDLDLTDPRGTLEARVDHGDIRLLGGHSTVALRLGRGDITIETLQGALECHSGAGTIQLTTVQGPITLKNGAGDLLIQGGTGELTAATGAGDITVRERTATALRLNCGRGEITVTGGQAATSSLRTGAGEIRCTASLGPDDHLLNSGAGDLHLLVPANLSARIEAITGLGEIHSTLPLVDVGQRGPKNFRGRRLVGSIGGDPQRATVRLRTGRGDLHLSWRGAASTEQPATPFASAWTEAEAPPADWPAWAADLTRRVTAQTLAAVNEEIGRVRPPAGGEWLASVVHQATSEALSAIDEALGGGRGRPGPGRPRPHDQWGTGPVEAATVTPSDTAWPMPPAASPPPKAPTVPADADARRKILDALAAGTLSVDEAERLLSALAERQPPMPPAPPPPARPPQPATPVPPAPPTAAKAEGEAEPADQYP